MARFHSHAWGNAGAGADPLLLDDASRRKISSFKRELQAERPSERARSLYMPLPYRGLLSTTRITGPNPTEFSLAYVFGSVTVRGNNLRAVYDAIQAHRCREIRIAPEGHVPGEGEPSITSVEFDIDVQKQLAEFPAHGGS